MLPIIESAVFVFPSLAIDVLLITYSINYKKLHVQWLLKHYNNARRIVQYKEQVQTPTAIGKHLRLDLLGQNI